MIKIEMPFPEGHNPAINHDKRIKCKGIIDATLKDREIILKGIGEEDILQIREILLEEIKGQNDKESKHENNTKAAD